MSSAQKIIKYLALAFASFLIFIIITSIISGMTILSNIFDDNDNNNQTVEKNESLISDSKDLNIDLATSDLIIKAGNKFKVETTNKYISVPQSVKSPGGTDSFRFGGFSLPTIYIV